MNLIVVSGSFRDGKGVNGGEVEVVVEDEVVVVGMAIDAVGGVNGSVMECRWRRWQRGRWWKG